MCGGGCELMGQLEIPVLGDKRVSEALEKYNGFLLACTSWEKNLGMICETFL